MSGAAILGALLVIPVLVLARLSDAGRVIGAFSATAAATVASFFLAWSPPASTPLDSTLRWSAVVVGSTVLAVLLAVAGTAAWTSPGPEASRAHNPIYRGATHSP